MLKINNVSVIFEKNTVNQKLALDKVDLALAKGDFVTIIGSNGAGKSTLFGAISGVNMPDEGQIFLEEKDITFLPDYKRAKKIGRILQDPKAGTAPHMTVAENLFLAYTRGTSRHFQIGINKKDRNFLKDHLEPLQLGLETRLDTKIGLLSGGQRQAVTLLMATMSRPDLLLLDEHTAALDPTTAEKVIEITEKIVRQNRITTLMITHNIHQALTLGNRTIMMHQGKVVLDLEASQKQNLSVNDLLDLFKVNSQSNLETDRVLFSK